MSFQEFNERLMARRSILSQQELKTLLGQARAGDVEAAMKGLGKLERRRRRR